MPSANSARRDTAVQRFPEQSTNNIGVRRMAAKMPLVRGRFGDNQALSYLSLCAAPIGHAMLVHISSD